MSKKMSVDLKVGEVLLIDGTAIRLEKKSGQVARLQISADEGTVIQNPQQRAGVRSRPGAHP